MWAREDRGGGKFFSSCCTCDHSIGAGTEKHDHTHEHGIHGSSSSSLPPHQELDERELDEDDIGDEARPPEAMDIADDPIDSPTGGSGSLRSGGIQGREGGSQDRAPK